MPRVVCERVVSSPVGTCVRSDPVSGAGVLSRGSAGGEGNGATDGVFYQLRHESSRHALLPSRGPWLIATRFSHVAALEAQLLAADGERLGLKPLSRFAPYRIGASGRADVVAERARGLCRYLEHVLSITEVASCPLQAATLMDAFVRCHWLGTNAALPAVPADPTAAGTGGMPVAGAGAGLPRHSAVGDASPSARLLPPSMKLARLTGKLPARPPGFKTWRRSLEKLEKEEHHRDNGKPAAAPPTSVRSACAPSAPVAAAASPALPALTCEISGPKPAAAPLSVGSGLSLVWHGSVEPAARPHLRPFLEPVLHSEFGLPGKCRYCRLSLQPGIKGCLRFRSCGHVVHSSCLNDLLRGGGPPSTPRFACPECRGLWTEAALPLAVPATAAPVPAEYERTETC
mmetsp:Transcript_167287/g.537344  ORF Transcript_167287/g.537344 Transcript_167287/m.537344 type:complete len:402 (-) Transcript_167287:38-1243(-)